METGRSRAEWPVGCHSYRTVLSGPPRRRYLTTQCAVSSILPDAAELILASVRKTELELLGPVPLSTREMPARKKRSSKFGIRQHPPAIVRGRGQSAGARHWPRFAPWERRAV